MIKNSQSNNSSISEERYNYLLDTYIKSKDEFLNSHKSKCIENLKKDNLNGYIIPVAGSWFFSLGSISYIHETPKVLGYNSDEFGNKEPTVKCLKGTYILEETFTNHGNLDRKPYEYVKPVIGVNIFELTDNEAAILYHYFNHCDWYTDSKVPEEKYNIFNVIC